MAGSFGLSLAAFIQIRGLEEPVVVELWRWFSVGSFKVPISLQLDQLSAVMLLVVTGIGLLIFIYSGGYMRGDRGYYRFFAYMSLFAFSMLTLVLAGNYLLLYFGWEAVGLCSYYLIGFFYHKPEAAAAGKKAFIVNRVGDFGFGLGVMLIFVTFGTLDYVGVFEQVGAGAVGHGTLIAIALLLFMGAMGKSAQFPLHVWLPDAMEGPTPVSALIHAATMVTAGRLPGGPERGHLRQRAGRRCWWSAPSGPSPPSSRPSSVSVRRTSRRCWPTPPSRNWGTCSWPWAWGPGRSPSST